MNKDKIIKDLKKRNDSLKMQYEYRNIRCIHLENENQQLKSIFDKVIGLIYDYQMNDKDNPNYKELLYVLRGGSDE